MPTNNIRNFCTLVCSEIGYRKVHRDITAELSGHLQDKMDGLVLSGLTPQEAEQQAVSDMGDPREIGRQLNKQHKPYMDMLLYASRLAAAVLMIVLCFQIGTDMKDYYFLDAHLDEGIYSATTQQTEQYQQVIDLDQKHPVDGGTVELLQAGITEQGGVSILYRVKQKHFWQLELSANFGFILSDGSGRIRNTYEAWGRGSVQVLFYQDFHPQGGVLYLDYQLYNRKLHFEIPIDGGGQK